MQAHQDGPVYEACVAIVSVGAPAVMRFFARQGPDGLPCREPCCSVVLPPRSLLVFAEDAYTSCLHGIDTGERDVLDDTVVNPWAAGLSDSAATGGGVLQRQGLRTSLTFRRAKQRAPLWL